MVREERLELSRVAPQEPKSSASANSATLAITTWGERWGSNPRPPESQSGALPTELRSPLYLSHLSCRPYMVRSAGLEPATPGLEGRCSIRLSYRTHFKPFIDCFSKWSGQRDSNPRPSAPKADALPDCAMPRSTESMSSDNSFIVVLGQIQFHFYGQILPFGHLSCEDSINLYMQLS